MEFANQIAAFGNDCHVKCDKVIDSACNVREFVRSTRVRSVGKEVPIEHLFRFASVLHFKVVRMVLFQQLAEADYEHVSKVLADMRFELDQMYKVLGNICNRRYCDGPDASWENYILPRICQRFMNQARVLVKYDLGSLASHEYGYWLLADS
jgi:hypothetical protein